MTAPSRSALFSFSDEKDNTVAASLPPFRQQVESHHA